jgi:hypothetical protein
LLSSVAASVVEKVFPVGTEIHMKSRVWSPCSRYWVIPGKMGEPRWILPHDPRYAWPLLREWRPYDFLSRVKWKLLMIAYQGKRLDCVPGVVPLRIIVPQEKNWGHLGWSQVDPPIPLVYVGTPSPQRKAVLGLIDSKKRKLISIAKVPLGPIADLAINREAANLDKLTLEKPGRGPRNLFTDSKNGIATQEFITGSPTGRRFTESHMAFLFDLVISGETISLCEVAEDLRRQIKTLDYIDPKSHSILERVLIEVDDPSPLPAVWEHGDFAPWNIKKVTHGSLRVIDWEASLRRGLPLFDLIFFFLIQALAFKEKALFSKSFEELLDRYLERLGIAQVLAEKIVRACIARYWLRFYEAGDMAGAAFFSGILSRPFGHLS